MFSGNNLTLHYKEGILKLIGVGKVVLEKVSFCVESGLCN